MSIEQIHEALTIGLLYANKFEPYSQANTNHAETIRKAIGDVDLVLKSERKKVLTEVCLKWSSLDNELFDKWLHDQNNEMMNYEKENSRRQA